MKTTARVNKVTLRIRSLSVVIFCLLVNIACHKEKTLPDYSQHPWIERYGYTSEEVFTVRVSGKVPGPEIPVTVESDQRHCLIDLSQYDLILQESAFTLKKFEPQRIVTHIEGDQEMLLEEGYIHEVSFLHQDFDLVFGKVLKRASRSIPSNGLIGRSFFMDKTLALDLDQRLIAVNAKPLNLSAGMSDTVSQITINYQDAHERPLGLIKFKGTLNDTTLSMTLSTANRYCQISPELVRQLDLKIRRDFVKLDSLQLGKHKFRQVTCAVIPNQILLEPEWPQLIHFTVGLNIIQEVLCVFDFKQNIMLLE